MIKLARMNFMKAKEYDRKFLDDKRDTFYRMFANDYFTVEAPERNKVPLQ
jgi:hypothetical protein